MATQNRILSLSNLIATNTGRISAYLEQHGLPTPSLDQNAPGIPLPDSAPDEIKTLRTELIDACSELKDLITGPKDLMRFNWTTWVSIKVILRFNLDLSFRIGETTTFEEMAKVSGLSVQNVTRIVRHAILNHQFFEEREAGKVVHSGCSAYLQRDEYARHGLVCYLDEFWPASVRTADALEKWPDSEENTDTGFALANDGKSLYEVLAEFPERGKKFGLAMANADEDPKFLIEAYPWAEHKTVVDIGGSHGSIMIDIARRFPHVTCVVQDLPHVVEAGQRLLPSELHDRISFQAHDFFTPQDVEADVYYLRSILHNWADKYSLLILKDLIPALKPGSRVLIHERMLPDHGTVALPEYKRAIDLDVGMLELLNAKQRSVQDWKELFASADGRYVFLGARQPKGATRWIIEAEWKG
ncbi:S-adenosyl-L-methionine-dependent methyltransferase [Lophiotrema nucula]|uniref:S-adenosyl-L-methionine-dependent methyltransferase n=1 Tax=Lophiotrema nucula TaxID=690887 RepID=A0A6A5YJA5_9PLEO|nr:S-adenosyl-L-methionine-dependent methyltransferase [Lophiotrema nucula]